MMLNKNKEYSFTQVALCNFKLPTLACYTEKEAVFMCLLNLHTWYLFTGKANH